MKPAKGGQTVYLGTLFIQSNLIKDQIQANLKHRAFNIKKFYDWLDINHETPVSVKITVLYNCMFAALTYSCEAWFAIDEISEELLKTERSLLRRILCVRDSTPNDLIYAELGIPDIVSKIKKRQFNYFQKIISLSHQEASVRLIIDMCNRLPCYQYYLNINPRINEYNISTRHERITSSTRTYDIRYSSIVGFSYCNSLYDNCLIESRRSIITRWRLSNHKLRIETGRYTRPNKTERKDRLCTICLQIEDEEHAIYHCSLYDNTRATYNEIFSRYTILRDFLNPKNVNDAYMIGSFLLELEAIHENFFQEI